MSKNIPDIMGKIYEKKRDIPDLMSILETKKSQPKKFSRETWQSEKNKYIQYANAKADRESSASDADTSARVQSELSAYRSERARTNYAEKKSNGQIHYSEDDPVYSGAAAGSNVSTRGLEKSPLGAEQKSYEYALKYGYKELQERQTKAQQRLNRIKADISNAEIAKKAADRRYAGNASKENEKAARDAGKLLNQLRHKEDLAKGDVDLYDNARSAKTERDNERVRLQYESVVSNKDFAEKSVPTDSAKKDFYTYGIYADDDTKERLRTSEPGIHGIQTSGIDWPDAQRKSFVNDRERGIYTYLYNTKGRGEAEKYIKSIETTLNERMAADQRKRDIKYAENHPAAATIRTVAESPGTGVSAFSGTVKNAASDMVTGKKQKLDVNAPYFEGVRRRSDTVGTVTKNMNGLGSFLYETGLSMGDMVMTLPLAALSEPLSLAVMSSNAAASAAYDATLRGADSKTALAMGTAYGAVEFVTEKIGLDNLFKIAKTPAKTKKAVISAIAKQMGAEGVEEIIAEVADNIIDTAVMGDESTYSTTVKEYIDAGYGYDESRINAVVDLYGKNVLLAGAGGALSGGVFGSGAAVGSNIKYNHYASVESDKAAQEAADAVSKSFGELKDRSGIQAANKGALAKERFDGSFLKAYTDAAASGLESRNSEVYRGFSEKGIDISQALFDYFTTTERNSVTDSVAFQAVVSRLKPIVEGAARRINIVNNDMGFQNETFNRQAEAIARGDFSVFANNDTGNMRSTEIAADGVENYPAEDTQAVTVNDDVSPDTESDNANIPTEVNIPQETTEETVPAEGIQEEKANTDNNSVENAVERSIYPELGDSVDLFEEYYGGTGLSGLIKHIEDNYRLTGSIGAREKSFFADGGAAVTEAIKSVINAENSNVENISDRTFDSVGNRNIKAFQYTYPQMKKYYSELANILLGDINATIKGERMPIRDESGYITGYTGTKRHTSEAVSRIKDATGASYDEISNALNRIITDNGQENIALAKRIELVMDDMLTEGYTAIDGTKVPPNDEYISEKEQISDHEPSEQQTENTKAEPIKKTRASTTKNIMPVSTENTYANESVIKKDNSVTTEKKQPAVGVSNAGKTLAEQIDEWDKNGRNSRVFFDFGAPSEVLKSVGITDNNIHMDASKVLKIFNDHKEMTIDVIKQLDKIIADPILILKSKAKNAGNSFVIFGEVAGENGVPVMTAVRTGLKGGVSSVEDVAKITSAYTKSNTQNFINSSEVLWVSTDKKRAADWMYSFGLQLPSATSNRGSSIDNSISHDNDIVNSSVRDVTENNATKLTNKCELIATKHTATGDDIWVVTLKDRLSSEEYKDLNGKVKAVGGYYSRYAKTPDGKAIPGFIFKTEPTAKEIKVFNDFFDHTGETASAETQTVKDADYVLKNEHDGDIIKENTDKDGVKNVESQPEILAGESKPDGRRLRAGASDPDVETGIEEADEPHRDSGGKGLSKSVGTDGNRPDVRDDSKRVHGTNDAEDAVSEASGNGTELTEEAPETIDTVDKSVEKKRPSNKNNFIITDDIAADFDNTRPSAEDNIAAIELLLALENEGRPATAEEKKILAKYKGWGGIDTRNVSWALRQKMLNLFNGEQLRNMQTSTSSAFFTPTGVIDAMYNGLKRMGFKGGNVLESSMGVGNFFGRMPSAMSAKSALTGVELESYTARIAQYLYPGATVINKPFQDVAIKNGSFDMVIGNVPFGNEKIRYGKKSYALHNYFIISSLDKVRDGGVVAVITSAGTLDSYGMDARQAIMDRADVVACYKLPAGVFSRNASTDVQTDLLILRKRADGAKPVGDSILNVTTTADGLRLNEYFVKNPQNILGTLAKGTNAWGEITTVLDDGNFYDKLNKAMGKLPKGLISGNIDLKPIETIVTTSSKPRFFEKDGKIYSDDGAGTATAIANGTKSQIVRDYMAVRDAYKELLAAYSNGETVKNADGTYSIREVSDADIKSLRKSLSKAYENFAKKHGAITGDGKKKLSFKTNTNRDNTFLEADADYYLVSGLEKYNTKAKQIEKSELFEKDTLKKKRITSVDTASDALIVSLNESGKVDFARMQELTGKTEKQLAEELKGEIVFTPDGDYVLTDVYLSGNIYEKLEKVKGKSEFKEQQEMLERVIPTPKDASSINIKLGANYIDTEYIEQFSREVFHERISVSKNSAGTWTVDGSGRSRYGDILNVKYGCEKFNAIQLLEKILNDSEITATDTLKQNGTSVTVYNPKMTEVARQKAEDIKSAFENWIFRDSERRTAIVDKYNRMYNNYRPLDFAHIAEKLSFESMDEDLRAKLYPHQKKGIARALFGGNVLFAHGVGTGKTFEMIASVMEAKRMGIVNKTAMVVPNNKVVDFKNDIAQAYPNAKVLVIDTANKKRQTMLGLVNSNDWDIVLVGKNTFTKIPVGAELQANYINEQVEELDKQITEAQFDRNTSKREMNRLTKLRDGLLRKLETVNSETKRDENGIEFEKLGFDCICVDEAHNYKSIITPSRLNIKGLSKDGSSQQANDMLMKLDYMRSIDGKIIFGTGTPITNTVSEIYNMMRMVRPDILEDAGIHSLDEWVNTFANIETQTEVGIDGRIKDKSTQIIKSFFNATEMIGMYRQFADVVFTDDVVKDLPDIEFIPVEIEGTEVHRAVQQAISKAIATAKRSEALSVYGKVMTMGSAAALDTRMLAGADSEYNPFKDYSVEELEYENSKVNVMCNYVLDNYKSFADIKGTQLIFCDGGAGTGDVYSFNVHKDIRQKLIGLGIPENEIVIMKNQNDAQLEELYAKVNSGEVRVLIGTSAKMAEGLNVQERVVAIHYPTVTYNPADLEQSMARGRRKGNINKKVKIYRYLQGNTFDSYKWQALERKGEMINRALRGEAVDELEDVTADIDPATAMAITSGNPLVKEKIDIDKEVKRLKVLKQNYMNEHYRYEDAVAKNPGQIRQLTEYAQRIEQDIALRDKHSNKAEISVKGKSFEKQTDANKALIDAVKTAPKNGQYTKLGTYNGFDIMFKGDTGGMGYSLILKGANEYSVEYAGSGNNIARIAGVLNRLDTELQRVQSRVKTLKTDLEFAKEEVKKPFEKEKELTEALEKQKDVTYRYEHYGEKTETAENSETEENTNIAHSSKDIVDTDVSSRWKTERAGGNENNNVNIADIVKDISDKFSIPVATGKVTDREASGIYKEKPETIRTRIANNLPTISHELGHHLNKKYNLEGMESVKNLRKALSGDFLNNYAEDERNGEAVAEFVRVYLRNINDADRLCPDFYYDFTRTLSRGDLKSINEIASAVNEYLSYDISKRYDAAITTSKKQEKLSFKEKWQRLYTNWVDAFYPQKEAVDYVEEVTGRTLSGKGNAYVLATNSLNAHTIANYLICEGFRDLDGNVIDAKSFVDSIGMVDSKNVSLLDKYLVLRHSLEWIAPTESDVAPKRVFADDTLENVEEIKKQIAQIEAEHPEIKTAAENLYEYQNNVLRHFVIPAGGMSEETLDMLNRKYPSYVPFYRAVGKRSGMAKGTFVNQRSPIMRAKGSGALILSPVESIIRNTEKMVKLALRNQTARVLSSYADTVDGFGQFMEAIPPDMIPHSVNIVKSKESFTDALSQIVSSSEDYFAVSDLFEQILGNEVTDFTPVANANKRIVTVLQDGRPTYYQIHDEALYNAVAELAPQQANGYVKWATKIMQPMKLLITQNNPIFAVTNAIRDFGTAYKLSEVNNLAVFAAQYVKALGGIITNNADYKRYKAMGGGHSSELSANIDNIARTLRTVAHKDMGKARRLAYSLFVHPVETVAMFNDAIESVPRFAEFQRTLKEGGDLQEAIFNASDITTNFKRSGGGVGVKIANSTFMFNNAAIQGLDKTFRTITNKDIKKRYKTLLKWLLNALIMGILGYLYNKEVDEEGYKNLSSYKKNNFYNFAIGDGKFISLPKPRENALLDSITERTIEYVFGDNKDAFYDFGTYLGQQLLPPMLPDTLEPVNAAHSVLGSTILGGIVDVGFNQDFKGTPIEGMYDKYAPSNERYTNSTTKIAYALGQTKIARDIDMSPKKIDHLISSYTGILGQVSKAILPMDDSRRDTSLGLRNKFISDSNYSTDVLNKMYDNQEKAKKAFMYSGSVSDAVEYEKNSVITSYISEMIKSIKSMPAGQQRNGRAFLLRSLNSWNYDSTASQATMLHRLGAETVTDDYIIKGLPKSTIEWTKNNVKYSYQMTPREYNEYVRDYLTFVEKYRTYISKKYSDTADYASALEKTNTEVKKELSKKYQQKYIGKAQKAPKE